jgi:hypothetical protein
MLPSSSKAQQLERHTQDENVIALAVAGARGVKADREATTV